ncbi:MAG TPA: hypothetical protein PKJ74_10165 [Chitinophagales bacterium]|nr:hypothetical protein [Chitinophagales bacterium]HNL17371.1 hypothetical protein [Chitinophagales bacterium]HNM66695.1 hypothetical protein [Chitinophagales bacterium]
MQKYIFLLFLFIGISFHSQAQFSKKDSVFIQRMEDTIKVYGDTMVNSQTEENRFIASYRIVKNLVSILKIKNSYQYQLDSLLPMQILNSPDNKFRIFTWFVINDNQQYRYFGAIQMNSDTLSLFPLVDYSEFIEKPETQTVDNNNWYGALYYQIVPVKQKKKTYYMLLGSNGFTLVSNKKVMDVLWFSEDNKPRFGAPLIEKDNKTLNRFILEFSNDTWAALRYVPEETKIIYDHVLPNDEDLVGFFSQYLPDGTYEGFHWKKGKWHHIDMIEYQKREDGEAPNVQKKEKIDYKNLYKKKVQ